MRVSGRSDVSPGITDGDTNGLGHRTIHAAAGVNGETTNLNNLNYSSMKCLHRELALEFALDRWSTHEIRRSMRRLRGKHISYDRGQTLTSV